MNSDYERIPPQSIDLERTVLGACLIDQNALAVAIDLLNEQCFYAPANRIVFNSIKSMFERNIPVDYTTIAHELKSSGNLEAVGDEMYIAELAESVTTSSNIEYYIGILIEQSKLRGLITISGNSGSRCFAPDAVSSEIIEYIESETFKLSDTSKRSKIESVAELLPKTFDEIEGYSKGKIPGIKTGFKDLDELTCGLQRSDLIVVAGRPSMGKTAFCLSVALNTAIQHKNKVLIFSLEMAKSQLMLRMLCGESRINMHSLRSGSIAKRDLPKLSLAAGPLSEAGIYIDDTPAISVASLRSMARRQIKKTGVDLIIIDYLQLMSGVKNENRQQEVAGISRGLKGVAKELNVPVMALSQLSRLLESRVDKRPMLSDLRESGAIEQDTDLVMFVYRDEVYNTNESNKGKADIIIGKQRNGPIGTVPLAFIKEFARFENITKQDDLDVFRG